MHARLLPLGPTKPYPTVGHGFPWSPDSGDGNFWNPVIHADYSDPDVIRHGDDFWMVASSFNCTPGVPVLHSKDLVNWTLVGHALQQLPHPRYAEVQFGCGVWAPAIRFHAGFFWVFIPMPDEGIYVTRAAQPAGPWSEPWLLAAAKGWIDPCPFWDDDGRAYLAHAYANSRAGIKERIHLRPMTPDCTRLLGEAVELFHTPHHAYLEGPKVHKMNGWYYIFAPGGGVATGWQVVFRSRHLHGPYEEKVVLEQGATPINGPHQGALVDAPDGKWWFIHFQDTGPFGRIVHLQPVEWKNDWPVIGQDHDGNGIGEPVARWEKPVHIDTPRITSVTSDEFDAPRLSLAWQWQANHDPRWISLTARTGWLRMFAAARSDLNLNLLPQLLAQKFPARSFSTETLLDLSAAASNTIAGLAIVGGQRHAGVGLRRAGDAWEIVHVQEGVPHVIARVDSGTIRLGVDVDTAARCQFRFSRKPGGWQTVDRAFVPTEGGWMGAKVGLFCVRNQVGETPVAEAHTDFDYFRFGPAVPWPNLRPTAAGQNGS